MFKLHRVTERLLHTTLALLLTVAGGPGALLPAQAAAASSGIVELSPTPPNLTRAVPPNIVVTFDDSGSMSSNYMGDNRPFDHGSWNGPWRCAGLIDPRVSAVSDIRSHAMNGVYYNPNVIYTPPIGADGTVFPNADATLKKVPLDAIGIHRPYQPVALDASAGYRNNPNGSANPTGATDLTGTLSQVSGTGYYYTGSGGWDTSKNPSQWDSWKYGAYPAGNGWYAAADNALAYANGPYPTIAGANNRWQCGYGSSPLDGKTTDSDGNVYPNGGPYYYRYTASAPVVAVAADGKPTAAGLVNLYAVGNWEAVAVPNTTVILHGQPVNQWQNFANWYAYYRTRNLMTRTALSRVFGALGAPSDTGGFGSSLRAAWQNLYTYDTFNLPSSTIISSLLDANSPSCDASQVDPVAIELQAGIVKTAPNCYRSAFFNWIFDVRATGNTPSRAAMIRAGKFFARGSGNTGSTGDLHDPYWQSPASGIGDGNELVCRLNYSMFVTDGYWNEAPDPALPAGFKDAQTATTLPDGTAYSVTAAESRVYWDVQGATLQSSMANIGFNYWATNLRPDLYDPTNGKIGPPYMVDTSTGVIFGASSPALEKYFNPNNDPANWPHLVQYMVTLGVPGYLTYSHDANCLDPNNDLCTLRRGQVNSAGGTGWTQPANNSPPGIDDTWHAAVNSRGAYFNASNPQNLVDQLTHILTNISARNVPATTSALNTSVLVQGAVGFAAGYSAADWSGVFQAIAANPDGTVSGLVWDAAQILTDAGETDPSTRVILTSKEKADGSFDVGIGFRTFTDLDNLVAGAGSSYVSAQALLSGSPPGIGASDTGQARIDWLRGVRTLENSVYRSRTNLLGAIINSQALFVGQPSSGYRNKWPAGSPEAWAMAGDAANCADTTPTTCHSYESFVSDHKNRTPAVYVSANDGMLHAFDAEQHADGSIVAGRSGHELWAYVPRSVYANLGNLTAKSNFKFAPTVDATPVSRDVFFGGGWHTLLVGGLRLGGRGVYALEITDPTQVTVANAGSKVLWEFNADRPSSAAGNPANLGYTFGQPNIGRLANGRWVVLVPGGYFPDCSKSDKPANCTTLAAASNGYSSLFVLDAQTGALISELKTLTAIAGVTSGGLSSVVLGDYNNDQVDDVAFAGDLNGNLWRYDFTDANPANWQAHVTLAFQPATQGAQPITVMPRLFPDPATNRFIVVFGTGKYLGAADNTSNSAATQSIYGIRDMLDNSGKPVTMVRANLQQQTLYEGLSTDGVHTVRGLTNNLLTATQGGWYIDLNLAAAPGERVVVTPGALFDTNRVILTTLIPGTQDPCSATIGGALMVFNAATGGAGGGLSGPPGSSGWTSGTSVVGGLVNNPPTGGSVPVATVIGGGNLLIPGLQLKNGGNLNIDDGIWRRRSWRELNNDQ